MTLALGFPHPDFLIRTLSANQLEDWLAYGSLEPFGSVREDYRSGTAAAMFHNAHKRDEDSALSWFDLFPNAEMPNAEPEPEPDPDPNLNPEESFMNFAARFEGWAAARSKKG